MSSNPVSPFVLNNLLSIKSASDFSGYSLQYLRRLLRNGRLTGIKIGQLWLIDKQSLDGHLLLQQGSDQRFGPRGNGNEQNCAY